MERIRFPGNPISYRYEVISGYRCNIEFAKNIVVDDIKVFKSPNKSNMNICKIYSGG